MSYYKGKYDFSTYPHLSDAEKEEIKEAHVNNVMSVVDEKGFLRPSVLDRQSKLFGILALTANPAHTLMWAHYADSHKGVCIGLSTRKKPLNGARPVHYMNEIPVIELDDMPYDIAAMYKSTLWAYEGEWRVLKRGAGSVNLGARSIRELIFGFACPDDVIAEVALRAQSSNPKLRLFRVRRDETRFNLKKVPIKVIPDA